MQHRTVYSWTGLLILAVLFLALTMLSNTLLRGARLDLTENNLYTLSQGTRNILANIEEPITLSLYFTEEASQGLPQIRAYRQLVREMMQEFQNRAGNELKLKFIDPEPFSEAEDQAAAYGLQAVPVGGGAETLYFGLVGTNSTDGVQVMPFLQPDKEEFLEYDLAKMIYALNQPEPLNVGLISELPLSGGFDPARGGMTPGWAIYDQLNQLFDVQTIPATESELPEGLDLLLLVHPKELSEDLRYAVDQFALRGGRVLAFVDPHAEQDISQGARQMGGGIPGSSSLPRLFRSWGIGFDDGNVVGDARYALQVSITPGQRPVRHVGILGLDQEAMADDDIITAGLESVNLSTAGHFTRAENATTTMQPLLQSSENSQLINTNRLNMLRNPADLLDGFQATGTIFNLAVRVAGEADTAFPELVAGDENGVSRGNINAVLVGDSDLLDDRLWVQRQSFFGQTILSPFADNGDLVINAVDNLMGNSDLISIRTRPTSARPFTRVERLRRDAEQRLRETEQRLQEQLRETEQRLNELQSARPEDGGSELQVFSPEQQAEIERFVQQRLEIRRELRQVRRELDKDIEALGTSLKIINIGLVPLLVVLVLLVLHYRRRRRGALA